MSTIETECLSRADFSSMLAEALGGGWKVSDREAGGGTLIHEGGYGIFVSCPWNKKDRWRINGDFYRMQIEYRNVPSISIAKTRRTA